MRFILQMNFGKKTIHVLNSNSSTVYLSLMRERDTSCHVRLAEKTRFKNNEEKIGNLVHGRIGCSVADRITRKIEKRLG